MDRCHAQSTRQSEFEIRDGIGPVSGELIALFIQIDNVNVMEGGINSCISYLQDRSIDWKETKIVFRTDRPVLLPVVDVALRDVDHSGKSGDVIIGEVCFKWA